jgi:serine protease Do
MEGRVIGLTAAIKTRSGGFQGVGLAVSSKLAKTIAGQLYKNGFVRRPYLGVNVADLDEATGARLKAKAQAGVLVNEVAQHSPGAQANIAVNDIIVKVHGVAVTTAREMQKVTLGLPIGETIDLVVMRKGQLFLTKLVVEEQPSAAGPAATPEPAQASVKFDAIGLVVAELSSEAATRAGLPKEVRGVVISSVNKNSLAEQSGLARGLVVLQVDKLPVTTAAAFRKAVEQANRNRGAVLHVLRSNGDVDFVILKLR